MTLTTVAEITEKIPLRTDEHGVIRIGKSRVSLETLMETYKMGATLEDLARNFPTLEFADILYVIGYYLNHVEEVEAYLAESEVQAEIIRKKIEALPDQIRLGEKLRERLGRS